MFDAEMGAELYADRLREAELPAAFPVYDAMGLDLANDRDLAWFERVIRDERANYVGIDSLRRLAPKAKEKDSDDMALIVARVARVSRSTGAAIVVVHHQGDSVDKLYRGSTGIIDQADALFGLLRDDSDEHVRKLTCSGGKGKMRYAAEPPDRWLRLVTAGGVILEPVQPGVMPAKEPPKGAADKYADQLRPAYATDPQLTQEQACAIVGAAGGNKSVRAALERLRREGSSGRDHEHPDRDAGDGDLHDDLVARIIRDLDAIELTNDCTNPLAHARHHEPHPDTGRTVCGLCHPPPASMHALNGGRYSSVNGGGR